MFTMLQFRILVLPDEGSDTTGVVYKKKLRGYHGLMNGISHSDPDDSESPMTPEVHHNHVVFVREGAVEVEIDGVTYLAMHINNVVGYISD